ncbi:hypothetical protein PsorP6_007684 [Peronosclerospora sorghi]|uniref:Uncharacterized protein n=1 Tax=Peronosclerospora sorghi TaxID=230839 RepID=A0ACC0W6R2_9STRA|nr:hypothetical protein PsorP6_007684 [Peronosclerospora sorghi]
MHDRRIFVGLVAAIFDGLDVARLDMKQNGKLDPAALSGIVRGAAVGRIFLWVDWSRCSFFLSFLRHETRDGYSKEEQSKKYWYIRGRGWSALRTLRNMRQNIPYSLMLVALDHFYEEHSEFRN